MVAGHLQEKKGLFYIVLSYQDVDNNRKTKWIPTNLPVKGNKKRAEQMLWEAREKFKPPVERGAMHSDMPFCEYLEEWLKIVKGSVRPATLASYASMVKFPIKPYFEKKHITLGDLKAVHIQKFYTDQLERVSPNSVIHYHAVIHKALKYAVKVELLNANPADRVELPKKEKFLSDYYDGDEINHLFKLVDGTDLELPVKLAAFYGLRRSEVIGLRWCAVDFFKELLLRKKAQQEEYRKVCGRSYCKDYLDYICVNPLGERIKCSYLTSGFPNFLEQHGMRRIRFHDLRHSCASLLLANGVPMKQIQEWLGHSDFSTTANVYAHLDYHSKITSAEAILTGLKMQPEA